MIQQPTSSNNSIYICNCSYLWRLVYIYICVCVRVCVNTYAICSASVFFACVEEEGRFGKPNSSWSILLLVGKFRDGDDLRYLTYTGRTHQERLLPKKSLAGNNA